jgi:tetrahydromethanopterin S-methyltransferase subunit G
MSEERFDAIERKLDTVAGELRQEIADLGRQMRVLHEDTIDRIAALAPDFGPIRREFTEADARLHDKIDRRLAPLEAQARRRRK